MALHLCALGSAPRTPWGSLPPAVASANREFLRVHEYRRCTAAYEVHSILDVKIAADPASTARPKAPRRVSSSSSGGLLHTMIPKEAESYHHPEPACSCRQVQKGGTCVDQLFTYRGPRMILASVYPNNCGRGTYIS